MISIKMKHTTLFVQGSRSARVVQYLEEQDIHAVNVEGGMNEWGDRRYCNR